MTSVSSREKDLELNEVGWWSHWTDVRWIQQKSYIMTSTDFAESFFNRAGFVECTGASEAISEIEAEFQALGTPPCFAVQQECKEAAAALESRGYTKFDGMSVLQLGRPKFKTAAGLTILSDQEVSATDWATAYSLSFYGDFRTRRPVSLIAQRLIKEPSVTLLEGKKGKRTVGVLAAFRTPGLLGAYCIGTPDKYRRMGIAGSLIHEAYKMASTEGRSLFLQTMISDNVEEFYTRRGFRRLYLKEFVRRDAPRSDSKRRPRL